MAIDRNPAITITFTDDPFVVLIEYPQFSVSTTVDVGPNPAWRSPQESNDIIADGVRTVLDHAYYACTGDIVERS